MSEKTYNINELLENKKQLEEKEKELFDGLVAKDLEYGKEIIIDHTNNKNNKEIESKVKVDINTFCQKYNGIVDELSKVRTAIQKFNAEKILGKIQERDNTRKKLEFLKKMKNLVPREKRTGRSVTRQDKDGVALETREITIEAMFSREDIEKKFDELASQERKINTEIQRENLNAKVSI